MMVSEGGAPVVAMAADVGGTFTDFVLVDPATSRPQTLKILTTSADPSEAVLEGARQFLSTVSRPSFQQFVHGTTLVINALVERKGARTALLSTRGLRDILEMRREKRHDVYDLAQPYPEPLVPRPWRKGIRERMLVSGDVLERLDEQEVRQILEGLAQQGVESVAVCLLHSYVNPQHERRVREILAAGWPAVSVSLSSEVNPEQGEYERSSTTVANAFVKPRMERYLRRLDRELTGMGLAEPMVIFSSHGGIIPVTTAADLPVFLAESGPAGGALAAAHVASLLRAGDVLAVDMGGTTAKMCGVRNGRVITRYDYEVARVSRFSPGSGLALRIPVVDIIEIGAGGGSIARVDDFGLLSVGPESAGADPGPACYGRGGALPTVTDADLVLGRVGAGEFLGGRMPLSRTTAEQAIADTLAAKLGMSIPEAAMGISDVVDESMAITASEYLRERGIDPRNVSMVAYGGMGPVHAASLADRMGIHDVLVAPSPAVFSALGFLLAPRSLELTQTYHKLLEICQYDQLTRAALSLAERARTLMRAASGAQVEFTIGMRYRGQWHPIDVAVSNPGQVAWTRERLTQRFEAAYGRLYEQISEDIPVETVNLRVRVSETSGVLQLSDGSPPDLEDPYLDSRQVIYSAGYGRAEAMLTPRLRRERLPVGFTAGGPLMIVEEHTTTVVPRGWELRVEPFGALRLRRV